MNESGRLLALIAAVCLAYGSASARELALPLTGPDPSVAPTASPTGRLQVFSARQGEVESRAAVDIANDWYHQVDFHVPAHTDYAICGTDGQLVRQVKNARRLNDGTPAMVDLAPGRYLVRAQAEGLGLVQLPVVIEPGRTTTVHFESGWEPAEKDPTRLVRLPHGGWVGWRAEVTAASAKP